MLKLGRLPKRSLKRFENYKENEIQVNKGKWMGSVTPIFHPFLKPNGLIGLLLKCSFMQPYYSSSPVMRSIKDKY